MRLPLPRFLMLAIAGVAASTGADARRHGPDAELRAMLAGRVAEEPVRCIALRNVTGSSIIDGRAIVYRMGRRLYVNVPRDGAERLHGDDILVTRSIGTNLCRLDMVSLVDRTARVPHAFVSLGDFVPYSRPRPPAR